MPTPNEMMGLFTDLDSRQIEVTTPADPTLTASATAVMMGCKVYFTPILRKHWPVSTRAPGSPAITNVGSRVNIIVTGTVANSANSDGVTTQLYFGTGTAPANGDAFSGTALGKPHSHTNSASMAATGLPFKLRAIHTNLTAGTIYWFDLGLLAITAGNATVKNLTFIIEEEVI